jgi:hypothetical protein
VDLPRIQSVLTEREFEAWLFYDHPHRDPIAYRILGLPEELPVSRGWFYLIPAQGTPENWYIASSRNTWTRCQEPNKRTQGGATDDSCAFSTRSDAVFRATT